jgi:hypothetical protein
VSRKRWIWTTVGVALLLIVAWAAWAARDQVAYAHIATGYAAKQTCSCLNVSGRSMESCLAEYPADVRGEFEVADEGDRVRASVLFGAISAEAEYEEGYGCRIIE